jgi:hypothetical protein
MKTALRSGAFPILSVPVVVSLTTGLFVVACGSSATRSDFGDHPSTEDAGAGPAAPSGPGFGTEQPEAGPAPSCAIAEAQAVKPPVDFIFTVAQCGSMSFAVAGMQANLNGLATLLQKSGFDYRVVLMAAKTGPNALCVPAPLAGPNCGSNGSVFRLVNQHIESTDTTALLMSTLKSTSGDTKWSDFLRPEALKVFVMTTDENADDLPAVQFDADLLGVAGNPFGTAAKRNYVVYPIIGANAYPQTTLCPGASQTGAEYQKLANMTGGKWYPVCNADFGKVLADIGLTVNAQIACTLPIPAVQGQSLDPANVNVKVTAADGKTTDILKDASKDCAAGADGWQYSADGKNILLCGSACTDLKVHADSKVSVEFGCESKIAR